jgi:hypothetical protein
MRVKSIEIVRWRHFQNIEIRPPLENSVVCLVGGNGTGKSQILELLAACSARIGLSPGVENRRGDPFVDNAEFEIIFDVDERALPSLDLDNDIFKRWDKTISVRKRDSLVEAVATGLSASETKHIIKFIKGSPSVHYLFLDADRSYPSIKIEEYQLAQGIQTDWLGTLKERSFKITSNLFSEWFMYFVGEENRLASSFYKIYVWRVKIRRMILYLVIIFLHIENH